MPLRKASRPAGQASGDDDQLADSDPKYVKWVVGECAELCREFQKAEARLSTDLSQDPVSDEEELESERGADESPGRRWRSFNRAGSYAGAESPGSPTCRTCGPTRTCPTCSGATSQWPQPSWRWRPRRASWWAVCRPP